MAPIFISLILTLLYIDNVDIMQYIVIKHKIISGFVVIAIGLLCRAASCGKVSANLVKVFNCISVY